MELETVNKLYLELSQIATAKTARELDLERKCVRRGKLIEDIFNGEETELSLEHHARASDELMGSAV